MAELERDLATLRGNQQVLVDEVQQLSKTNGGNTQVNQSCYHMSNMNCNLHMVNGLRPLLSSECIQEVNFGENVDRSRSSDENNKNAHMVFEEMPNIGNLKQNGTIREYYDAFNSLISKTVGLNEWQKVNYFVRGLQPEFEKRLGIYKPSNLYDAYCLATMEETARNIIKKKFCEHLLNFPLFRDPNVSHDNSMVLNESKNEGDKSAKIELFDHSSCILRKLDKEESSLERNLDEEDLDKVVVDGDSFGKIGVLNRESVEVKDAKVDKGIRMLRLKDVEGQNDNSETGESRGIYEVGELKLGIYFHLNQPWDKIVKNEGVNSNGDGSESKKMAAYIQKLNMQDYRSFDGVGYIQVEKKNFDKTKFKESSLGKLISITIPRKVVEEGKWTRFKEHDNVSEFAEFVLIGGKKTGQLRSELIVVDTFEWKTVIIIDGIGNASDNHQLTMLDELHAKMLNHGSMMVLVGPHLSCDGLSTEMRYINREVRSYKRLNRLVKHNEKGWMQSHEVGRLNLYSAAGFNERIFNGLCVLYDPMGFIVNETFEWKLGGLIRKWKTIRPGRQVANELNGAIAKVYIRSEFGSIAPCMGDGPRCDEEKTAKNDNISISKRVTDLGSHSKSMITPLQSLEVVESELVQPSTFIGLRTNDLGCIQKDKNLLKRRLRHLWPKWKSKSMCSSNAVAPSYKLRSKQRLMVNCLGYVFL